MARVSKKVSAAQREAENAQHRIWKTAIYARLSDFDDVLRNSDRQKLKKRKNWPLFKKNCSRKSKSQATQRFF